VVRLNGLAAPCWVMTLITPPMALLPETTDDEPRTTSMRSMVVGSTRMGWP
jgi:hypothetical protein